MSDTTTFSVYVTEHVAQQISQNAEREGLSRSAYVLSWLPEANTTPSATDSNNGAEQAVSNARPS